MKYLLITISLAVALPGIVFAQEKFELNVGDAIVPYTELKLFDDNGDSIPDKWSYRLISDGVISIAATGFDTTDDENVDLWLVYEAGDLVLEARDTTGDGNADLFFEFSSDEVVTKSFGAGLVQFERTGNTKPFVIETEEQTIDDIVGDLSDIDDLYTKGSSPLFKYLIIILPFGIGWYVYKSYSYIVFEKIEDIKKKKEV